MGRHSPFSHDESLRFSELSIIGVAYPLFAMALSSAPNRRDLDSGGDATTSAAPGEGARSARSRHPALRVSQTGTLALCGLSRFPVTLDKEQWLALLDMAGEIRAFIADHEGELKPAI